MSRPLRIFVAALSMVGPIALYLVVNARVRAMPEPFTVTRTAVDPLTLVTKGRLFFAPLNSMTAPIMESATSVLRWVVILLVGVTMYLACGLVTRRTAPIMVAATGAAAATTATALGDLLWWATLVFRIRFTTTGWYANEALDHSTLLASAHLSLAGWTSDALFLGFLVALTNAGLVVSASLAMELRDWLENTDDEQAEGDEAVEDDDEDEDIEPGVRVPLIGDVRWRGANLALAGVLPVLVLMLINGTQAMWHSYSGRGYLALLRQFLYRPALSPPPRVHDDPVYRLTHEIDPNPLSMDVWTNRSVLAVALLLVLWLLLWAVLAGLPSSGHRLGLVVVCWGVTIAASALIATSNVVVHCAIMDIPTGCAPWKSLDAELTSAMRFGAAWGGLVSLLVLLARRLLRAPEDRPSGGGRPTDTSIATQETPVHEPT